MEPREFSIERMFITRTGETVDIMHLQCASAEKARNSFRLRVSLPDGRMVEKWVSGKNLLGKPLFDSFTGRKEVMCTFTYATSGSKVSILALCVDGQAITCHRTKAQAWADQ